MAAGITPVSSGLIVKTDCSRLTPEQKDKIVGEKLAEITLKAWTDISFRREIQADPEKISKDYQLPLGEKVVGKILVDEGNKKHYVVPVSPLVTAELNANLDMKGLSEKHARVACSRTHGGGYGGFPDFLNPESDSIIEKKLAEITLKAWIDATFAKRLKYDPQSIIREFDLPLGKDVEVIILVDDEYNKHYAVPESPVRFVDENAEVDMKALAETHASITCTRSWGGHFEPPPS